MHGVVPHCCVGCRPCWLLPETSVQCCPVLRALLTTAGAWLTLLLRGKVFHDSPKQTIVFCWLSALCCCDCRAFGTAAGPAGGLLPLFGILHLAYITRCARWETATHPSKHHNALSAVCKRHTAQRAQLAATRLRDTHSTHPALSRVSCIANPTPSCVLCSQQRRPWYFRTPTCTDIILSHQYQ